MKELVEIITIVEFVSILELFIHELEILEVLFFTCL